MSWVSTLASAGMAVGPPLVYVDQYFSIIRRKSSMGFSLDVCGVLIVANITRCYYWLGARFEIALLIQSILMIVFQLFLLEVCLRYGSPAPALPIDCEGYGTSAPQPTENADLGRSFPNPNAQDHLPGLVHLGGLGATAEPGASTLRGRCIGNFWAWRDFGMYLEFISLLVACHSIFFLLLQGFGWYIEVLGALALGLESTLPIPQLIANFQRKSLAGFRITVILGWLLGDGFKSAYFFLQAGNSAQFKICALLQLSVDLMIVGQAILYRGNTKRDLVVYANIDGAVSSGL